MNNKLGELDKRIQGIEKQQAATAAALEATVNKLDVVTKLATELGGQTKGIVQQLAKIAGDLAALTARVNRLE